MWHREEPKDFARHFAELPGGALSAPYSRPRRRRAAALPAGDAALPAAGDDDVACFILGLLPLVLATGASELARRGRMLERAPAKC